MTMRFPAAALLLLAACQTSDVDRTTPADTAGGGQIADTASRSGADPGLPARPEVRQDTLMIEGMPEVAELTLLRSPDAFRLPFSTYVPEGIRASFEDDVSVRFSAAFGGVENEDAYMQVHVYGEGETRAARDVVDALLRSRDPAAAETIRVDQPGWALESVGYAYTARDGVRYSGRVTTGRHQNRDFHVVVHYPAEYGDGMGPRLDRLLREWRWDDTGGMLVR